MARGNFLSRTAIAFSIFFIFSFSFHPVSADEDETGLPPTTHVIIELKERPIAAFETYNTPAVPRARENIKALQNRLLKDIHKLEKNLYKSKGLRSSQAPNLNYRRRFHLLFSGAAIDVSTEIIDDIRALDYVKEVHVDEPVEMSLNQSVPLIGADLVWAPPFGYDGTGVVIGVVDSGVDYTHPDFHGDAENCDCVKLSAGLCSKFSEYWYDRGVKSTPSDPATGCNSDPDAAKDGPMDVMGHGTHVAGILAADGDPASGGVRGVAPGAKIMILNAFSPEGSALESDVIGAMSYAYDPDDDLATPPPIRVLNLSLSGPGTADSPLSMAANTMVFSRTNWVQQGHYGIVVVAAAGNYGDYYTVGQPAAGKFVVAVGATRKDAQHTLAGYSSMGPSIPMNVKPDMVAPGGASVPCTECGPCYNCPPPNDHGGDICSSRWPGETLLKCVRSKYPPLPYPDERNCNGNDEHIAISGTSMAAPMVAGVAALVVQGRQIEVPPGCTTTGDMQHGCNYLSAREISRALIQSADPAANYSVFEEGAGFLNAVSAMEAPAIVYEQPDTSYNRLFYDGLTGPAYSDYRNLFLYNLLNSDETYILSIEGNLPAGINAYLDKYVIDLPARALIHGMNQSIQRFELHVEVDNTVVPLPPNKTHSWDGFVRIESSSTGRAIRVPFAVVVEKIFTVYVNEISNIRNTYPIDWSLFDPADGSVISYERGAACDLFKEYCYRTYRMNPGTYDMAIRMMTPSSSRIWLIRQGVEIGYSSPSEMYIDHNEATAEVLLQPVDENGKPFDGLADGYFYLYNRGKQWLDMYQWEQPISAPLIHYTPQPAGSDVFSIEIQATFLNVDNGKVYFIGDKRSGFSGDIVFQEDPAEYFHVRAVFDDLDDPVGYNMGFGVSRNAMAYAALLLGFPPPYRGEWYEYKHPDFTGLYSGSNFQIYDKFMNFIWKGPIFNVLNTGYADVYQKGPDRQENPLPYYQKRDGELSFFNTGPLAPFVRLINAPGEIRAANSILMDPSIFLTQTLDYPKGQYSFELYQGENTITSGVLYNFSPRSGQQDLVHCRLLADSNGSYYQKAAEGLAPGSYTLKILSSTYRIGEVEGTTEYRGTANTSLPDPNPPFITMFRMERDGVETEIFYSESENKIKFSLADDVNLNKPSVTLSYRVHGSGEEYAKYTVKCVGGVCEANPSKMQGDSDVYLDLEISARDNSGNVLDVRMEPAAKFEKNYPPGTMFASGGLSPFIYLYNSADGRIKKFLDISPILHQVPEPGCDTSMCGSIYAITGLAFNTPARELYFTFIWQGSDSQYRAALGKTDLMKNMTLLVGENSPGEFFTQLRYDLHIDGHGNIFSTAADGRLIYFDIAADPKSAATIFDDRPHKGFDGDLHPFVVKESQNSTGDPVDLIIAPAQGDETAAGDMITVTVDPSAPSAVIDPGGVDIWNMPLSAGSRASMAYDPWAKFYYIYVTASPTSNLYRIDEAGAHLFASLETQDATPPDIEVNPLTGDVILLQNLANVPTCMPDGSKTWHSGGWSLFAVHEGDDECDLEADRISTDAVNGDFGDLTFAAIP